LSGTGRIAIKKEPAMAVRILMVAADKTILERYEDTLRRFDIQLDTVSSFTELHDRVTANQYHGVLLDERVEKAVGNKGEAAEFLRDMRQIFPVTRIGRAPEEPAAGITGTELSTLDHFVKRSCAAFKPRFMRSAVRYPCILNVLVSEDIEFVESRLVRTVTLNVSEGGIFLHYCNDWRYKDKVWFVIKELQDCRPMQGEIRWKIPWGKTHRYPGLGVKFTRAGQNQVAEMMAIARKAQNGDGADN
jgi:Tfp pilus assembly protein PilZ